MNKIETAARAIYESYSFYGEDKHKKAWVVGGNSIRQDQARKLALAAMASLGILP